MLHKLRWKLTAFNTLVTGGILVCMVLLCLSLSERNTREQTLETFSDTVYGVRAYLQVQNQLSGTWLRQMEADPNVHLWVLDGGQPLFSTTLPREKAALAPVLRQAREQAAQAGEIFSMGDYYAVLCRIPKQESVLELIMLYSLQDMQAKIHHQRLLVLLAGVLAVGTLGLFSWCFTGKLLAPIQESQRRQTAFVAAASHELRTPLAAILSAASAMEVAQPPQRAQFSHMIAREGGRMSRLIGDMLQLASADSGTWQLNREPVELEWLLLEAYETHAPLAQAQGQRLTLSLQERNLPPVSLDADRMAQVLSILLENARNHTPAPGTIQLTLASRGNRVQIRVSDSGPGVADGEKERIFQRFYRGEASRSTRDHFGLGLSIAWEIVRAHGGGLWVQDSSLGGAEFVVELPLGQRDEPLEGL